MVALMGVAFLVTAIRLRPDPGELLSGLLVPRIPSGGAIVTLGLVGTTVVPYNLFMGSALARRQRLSDMRLGLAVAIGGGGLISLAIVVVGTTLGGGLEYERLAAVLASRLGEGAEISFALGLFGAGFTSAITAPLAAAITARTLLGRRDDPSWHESSPRYRATWAGVLLVGVLFGVAGIRPVPAIILAQALNGLLLPLVAVFLWIVMNDRTLLGKEGTSSRFHNLVMGAVVAACLVLGLRGIWAAAQNAIAALG
jgi:Mn2+/Fe2+ NRAMP family transporter